ncbi:efflux RND transporter permease subunit [Paraburkholderia sp. CNPSo 3274]|uniref:efflux RND transporter permease subunit n=1 Tax=unclassified Paraburkholderia TaxID=2615204 RepID=UPI0020B65604|nr:MULTISPECIES: efflux RND transporter permease subunit [unclassified Paraburkholderia]MCP3712089.1 efflux RND transporter permease subunit [Paraburkholderia sp. CNPSo 3274]MCP3719819.1 efflux RND transporter permease subunit [Paraburkholderia sp. CNPSo 3281]
MKFTDIFLNRPVLASVLSLLILVLGLRSLSTLKVSEYPQTQTGVVTLTTSYYGASADTMAGFITQPLEAAIAQVQGIDYMSSKSSTGVSTINATLRMSYDPNRALTQINTQLASVRNQLPREAQQPVLTMQVGQTTDAMYMGFYSDVLPPNNVTDYLLRVVKPKLDSIQGVQTAEILGGRQFALRAWLDSTKLAAHSVTASDVYTALGNNNYLATLGTTKGQMTSVSLNARTDVHSVEDFQKLAVKQKNGVIVRLEDVANVVLGADNYDSSVAFGGKRSVFIGIKVAPDANVLDVARRVKAVFPDLQKRFPTGMAGDIVYDATDFINSAIDEVVKTLVEALLIVTAVIFLFFGRLRAVIVPVVAMPLSLIGTFFMMQLLGYSINLLTLLAMVLAIGLVVDDAIIVVENVDRHMNEGKPPMEAALAAARELGGPILAMTAVLIAAYLPIGFQGGLTGALFTEFAFTLASAVAVSGVIALTLSPMMCSRIFRNVHESGRFAVFVNRQLDRVHAGYARLLHAALDTSSVFVVMGVMLLCGTVYLFSTSQAELAPQEDQGIVLSLIQGPPNATVQQMQTYADQVLEMSRRLPEYAQMFQLTGLPTLNQGFGGVLFKTWDKRKRGATDLQQDLQQRWNSVAGARVAAFQFPPLPGAQGFPVQFVISTTEPFENLDEVTKAVLQKARESGMFLFVDSDLRIDEPEAVVTVDRDKIASLGLTQSDVGQALGAALGGNYANYFSIAGHSYKVIPQVQQIDRLNPSQVLDYYLRTPDDNMIPAATVAYLKQTVVPESINRFQQLNAATISAVISPSVSQGEVLDFLRKSTTDAAPAGYNTDYAGLSRQFMQDSGNFLVTLTFATIIVFLVLSAQFESFRDALVILVSVPMALFGALVFINTGFSTLNIYTQVGLVTLMGLVSKHGILIVQFANQLQRMGRGKREALEEAAGARLRPILMTTVAMVLGVLPLVVASGAGAAGRNAMGLVIFTGLSIGTAFTLFVVPAMYMLLGANHQGTPKDQS